MREVADEGTRPTVAPTTPGSSLAPCVGPIRQLGDRGRPETLDPCRLSGSPHGWRNPGSPPTCRRAQTRRRPPAFAQASRRLPVELAQEDQPSSSAEPFPDGLLA